jgi:hypothetical protein
MGVPRRARKRYLRVEMDERTRRIREEGSGTRERSEERAPSEPATAPLQKLARTMGNQAFTQLVHRHEAMLLRENGGGTATAEAKAKPREQNTEFGYFIIYPNTEKLGPAAYHQMAPGEYGPADAFRVTEATFAKIELAMKAVKAGSGWLKLDGSDAFKAKVMPDLAWIMTSSVGQEFFDAMAKTGQKMTIKETTSGNATSYDPDADSWEKDDGTPGKGCDVTVEYNTGEWNPYGGTEEWMTRPPAIGMAHEMVHGWTGMMGTRAKGTVVVEGVTEKRREMQATGLGDWEKAKFSENKFRAAFGLPPRPRYTT